MLMSIKEYAAARNISVQAAYKKLHKYQNLKGHIRKEKGKWLLDSYAQKILDGKFPYIQSQDNQEYLLQECQDKIKILEEEKEELQSRIKHLTDMCMRLAKENADLKNSKPQKKGLFTRKND